MWMVRAGRGSEHLEDFIENDCIAIGWNEIGNIRNIKNKEGVKELIRKKYDYKKGRIRTSASQLYKFVNKMNEGDYILTYDTDKRVYHIGKITGDYEYDEYTLEKYHVRDVEWLGKIDRDDLSNLTKNTLGSITTLFQIREDSANEILSVFEDEDLSITED